MAIYLVFWLLVLLQTPEWWGTTDAQRLSAKSSSHSEKSSMNVEHNQRLQTPPEETSWSVVSATITGAIVLSMCIGLTAGLILCIYKSSGKSNTSVKPRRRMRRQQAEQYEEEQHTVNNEEMDLSDPPSIPNHTTEMFDSVLDWDDSPEFMISCSFQITDPEINTEEEFELMNHPNSIMVSNDVISCSSDAPSLPPRTAEMSMLCMVEDSKIYTTAFESEEDCEHSADHNQQEDPDKHSN